jgi:hypothetical protein
MLQPISRRTLLRGAGAALAGITFTTAFGLKFAHAQDGDGEGDDAQTILNVAATAETFAVTHYYRALQTDIFNDVQREYLMAGLDSEWQHLLFLNANGGESVADEFYFPRGTFDNTLNFSAVTSIAETLFVAAYLAATNRFAELGEPALAATAAQVAVVEGQHLALVRLIGSELPNNISLGEALLGQVSQAVGVIAPLLDGKSGALGAMEKDSFAFPGADAVMEQIGTSTIKAVDPFIVRTL